MSIETARIEWRRSPSSVKKSCQVALLRPGADHYDRRAGVVDDKVR
jgi:hypothetical protein